MDVRWRWTDSKNPSISRSYMKGCERGTGVEADHISKLTKKFPAYVTFPGFFLRFMPSLESQKANCRESATYLVVIQLVIRTLKWMTSRSIYKCRLFSRLDRTAEFEVSGFMFLTVGHSNKSRKLLDGRCWSMCCRRRSSADPPQRLMNCISYVRVWSFFIWEYGPTPEWVPKSRIIDHRSNYLCLSWVGLQTREEFLVLIMHTGIHMLYPAFGMTIYGQIENIDRRVEQLRI